MKKLVTLTLLIGSTCATNTSKEPFQLITKEEFYRMSVPEREEYKAEVAKEIATSKEKKLLDLQNMQQKKENSEKDEEIARQADEIARLRDELAKRK